MFPDVKDVKNHVRGQVGIIVLTHRGSVANNHFFFSALGRTFHGFHHGLAKVTAAMEMVLHSKVWSMYIPWNLLGDLFHLMSVASI